jgi:hypothetical protein
MTDVYPTAVLDAECAVPVVQAEVEEEGETDGTTQVDADGGGAPAVGSARSISVVPVSSVRLVSMGSMGSMGSTMDATGGAPVGSGARLGRLSPVGSPTTHSCLDVPPSAPPPASGTCSLAEALRSHLDQDHELVRGGGEATQSTVGDTDSGRGATRGANAGVAAGPRRDAEGGGGDGDASELRRLLAAEHARRAQAEAQCAQAEAQCAKLKQQCAALARENAALREARRGAVADAVDP